MDQIAHIDAQFIETRTHYPDLIDALEQGFASDKIQVPLRHHHDFPNPAASQDSTMLLMPAWQPDHRSGVKVVVVSPDNGNHNLPAIQGFYMLFDVATGSPKALVDAKKLTAKRTAAASVLAAKYLAKPSSASLLVVGTGALAPELILAYTSLFDITEVTIWGRDIQKAKRLSDEFASSQYSCSVASDLKEAVSKVDIISCATLSSTPLIDGAWLKAGQHLDLIGAYKPDMREANDRAIEKASVFVDTFEGGLKESGDIVIPMNNGTLTSSDIHADLFGLCRGTHPGRAQDEEITLFKSVGHALEDLVAANYYFDQNSL